MRLSDFIEELENFREVNGDDIIVCIGNNLKINHVDFRAHVISIHSMIAFDAKQNPKWADNYILNNTLPRLAQPLKTQMEQYPLEAVLVLGSS